MIARGRKYRTTFTGRLEVTYDGRIWWTLPRNGFPDCTICKDILPRRVVRGLGDKSLGHCKARDVDIIEMPRICGDYKVGELAHPKRINEY
jgi:hypothetical protein